MELKQRLKSFIELGKLLDNLEATRLQQLKNKAFKENPWFTNENVDLALKGVRNYLDQSQLISWLESYSIKSKKQVDVGIIMAGNIPLVGFHDFLCVIMSGNSAQVKISSKDSIVTKFLFKKLIEVDPSMNNKFRLVNKLNKVDAVIATGSDNSARFFNHYYKDCPRLIRKNRTSVGIIKGDETPDQLKKLGDDIFQYFGLGCRNISKLFVPKGYDLRAAIGNFQRYKHLIDHKSYSNNYLYNKTKFLMKGFDFLDPGFILIKEDKDLVSPISVLYYEEYQNIKMLRAILNQNESKIQCILSHEGWFDNSLPFGTGQLPKLWDYADNRDTMRFLFELGNSN